ncbi:hypothetical protein QFC21_002535 [Naganishia friedmannii]|uniref:Uncharacterized protein n=1 Tax=Naganishia friedmannii TaxID=89922 RepID=A0ACC2VVF1_9TREE|nr:hypothetical protein QFC21_002535 [Naganishia friedmannii]
MKSFSQFAHGVRNSRKQVLSPYTSASCRALLRNQSTSGSGAGRNAAFAWRNSIPLPAALTAALAGGGILYYTIENREKSNGVEPSSEPELVSPETFTVRLDTERGVMEYVHPYPGDNEAEKLLQKNATSRAFKPMTLNGVVRFDNNWVGCNDPCEDRHVESYLSRDLLFSASPVSAKVEPILVDQPEVSSLKLFSMIDGHGGVATADVLARDLHPRVIRSLQSLYGGKKPSTVDPMQVMRKLQRGDYRAFLQQYFSMVGTSKGPSAQVTPSVSVTSDFVSASLASAYMGLDYDICSGPLRLIANTKDGANTKAGVKAISEPATNGACALTVLVDEEQQEVYVANTGDSRAVAGYYVPPQTDSNGIHYHGGWRCEVLTEDHSAISPAETKRLQKEHPGEEDKLVSDNGRVLGDLMPARAFDSVDKAMLYGTNGPKRKQSLPHTISSCSIRKLKWKSNRTRPVLFDALQHKPPPYVVARPDVTFKSLKGDKRTGQLKFIILATDGLWENISSEDAVGLVTTHLAHPEHSSIERKKVQDGLIAQRKESADKYPGGRKKGEELKGEWVYKDQNVATHLIRNALEACKWFPDVGKHLITAKAPIARRLRDDITCSVIFFGDANGDILTKAKEARE